MNPAFVILVMLAAVALWFLLSFVFFPLGKFIYRIWKDAIDEINRKDKEENKEEKETE